LSFLSNFLSANLFILSCSEAIRNVRLPRLNFPYGKLQYKKEKAIRGEWFSCKEEVALYS
jgi:hypothetical protein